MKKLQSTIKPIASVETHIGKPPKPPTVKPVYQVNIRPPVKVRVYVTSHGVHAIAELQTPGGPAKFVAIVPLKPYFQRLHRLLQNPQKAQQLLKKLHAWGDKKWIFGPPGHKHTVHVGAEPFEVEGIFSTDGDEYLTQGLFSSLKKAALGAIPGAKQIAQGAAMIAKNKAVKGALKKVGKALKNPMVAKSLNLAATLVPGGATAIGVAKLTANLTQKALLGDKNAHNKIAAINNKLKIAARTNPKAKAALKVLTKVSEKVAEKAPMNPLRGMSKAEAKLALKVAKASPAAKKAVQARARAKQAHKAAAITHAKASRGDVAPKKPCPCVPPGYHLERDLPGHHYSPASKGMPHAQHAHPAHMPHAQHARPPVHAAIAAHPTGHAVTPPFHPVPRLPGPARAPLLTPAADRLHPSEPLLPGVAAPKAKRPKPKIADGSKTPWFLRKPIPVSQTPPAPQTATHGEFLSGDNWGYHIGVDDNADIVGVDDNADIIGAPFLPPPPALLAAQGYNAAQTFVQHFDSPNQSKNGAQVLANSMGRHIPISHLNRA